MTHVMTSSVGCGRRSPDGISLVKPHGADEAPTPPGMRSGGIGLF